MDGPVRLKVRVRAVPDKGAANKAVTALLAKAFGRPKSAFTLTAGASGRAKSFHVEGASEDLCARLSALVESVKGRVPP